MNKTVKIILYVLLALMALAILYRVVRLILLYFKVKKAFDVALSNTKYCPPQKICQPTNKELKQQLPNLQEPLEWNIEIAKYCSIIIYSISTGASNKVRPSYPAGLNVINEFYDNKSGPIFGSLLSDKNKNLWLSFRGTLSEQEWKQDTDFKQDPMFQPKQIKNFLKGLNQESSPSIHQGFVEVYMNFRDDLYKALEQYNPTKTTNLVVSGHSLGAAISTLVGADLRNSGYENVIVYNFASPKVGNHDFCHLVDQTLNLPVYRVVNISDIVPDLPLSVSPNIDSPNNPYMYEHCGTIIPFSSNRLSILNNHLIPVYMDGLANMPS